MSPNKGETAVSGSSILVGDNLKGDHWFPVNRADTPLRHTYYSALLQYNWTVWGNITSGFTGHLLLYQSLSKIFESHRQLFLPYWVLSVWRTDCLIIQPSRFQYTTLTITPLRAKQLSLVLPSFVQRLASDYQVLQICISLQFPGHGSILLTTASWHNNIQWLYFHLSLCSLTLGYIVHVPITPVLFTCTQCLLGLQNIRSTSCPPCPVIMQLHTYICTNVLTMHIRHTQQVRPIIKHKRASPHIISIRTYIRIYLRTYAQQFHSHHITAPGSMHLDIHAYVRTYIPTEMDKHRYCTYVYS